MHVDKPSSMIFQHSQRKSRNVELPDVPGREQKAAAGDRQTSRCLAQSPCTARSILMGAFVQCEGREKERSRPFDMVSLTLKALSPKP